MPERLGEGVLSWASMLDEKAREQALRTATVAAISGHVAFMPDAHWGMGCTIGSVIPTREAIIPSAVGVDIGCGVIAAETDLVAADLPDDLTALLHRWDRGIPAGLGYWHTDDDPDWAGFVREHGLPERVAADQRLRDRAPKQFGTLGSGNHTSHPYSELSTRCCRSQWTSPVRPTPSGPVRRRPNGGCVRTSTDGKAYLRHE